MEDLLHVLEKFEPYADFLDMRLFREHRFSAILKNEEISCGGQNISGAGVRALVEGCWAFSSTSSLSSVEDTVEKVIRSARHLGPGSASVPTERFRHERVSQRLKKNVEDIDVSEKIADLRILQQDMMLPHIKETKIFYNESYGTRHIVNTMGCYIEQPFSQVGIDFFSVAFQEGRMEMASDRKYREGGYELLDGLGSIPYEVSRRAENLLSAELCKESICPVVLDSELAGVLAHEALGHCVEADTIEERGSVLGDKVGKRIACEELSVCDNPQLHEGSVFFYYDDEGILGQETFIIEKGVLRTLLHSLETASQPDVRPVGKTRVSSYSSRPVIRMTNTYILPGGESFEEMVESVKKGIFLAKTFGGEMDTASGSFVFKSQEGQLIERGEFTRRLKNVLVFGTLEEFLLNVKGIGRELNISSGTCSKADQIITIGSGGPPLSLTEMKIGVSV